MKTKQIILISLVLLLAAPVNSCKKEYPKDIPGWLKTKIKQLDKQSRKGTSGSHDCLGDLPMTIDEYSDGSSVLYFYDNGATGPGVSEVYNSEGKEECSPSMIYGTCGNINNLQDYHFVRRIWTEHCRD